MLNNIVTPKPQVQNFCPCSECLNMFSSPLNEELILKGEKERAGGVFNTMGCVFVAGQIVSHKQINPITLSIILSFAHFSCLCKAMVNIIFCSVIDV